MQHFDIFDSKFERYVSSLVQSLIGMADVQRVVRREMHLKVSHRDSRRGRNVEAHRGTTNDCDERGVILSEIGRIL